jgi:hypothetical protein
LGGPGTLFQNAAFGCKQKCIVLKKLVFLASFFKPLIKGFLAAGGILFPVDFLQHFLYPINILTPEEVFEP